MNCIKSNGDSTTVAWRIFYPRCGKVNLVCNRTGGAYVAAITICRLGLFA